MRKVLVDIAERTLAAYVTTFLGLLIADGFDLTSVSAIKAAAIAALPAALSVIKGAIGTRFGEKESAAWIPRGRGGKGAKSGKSGKGGRARAEA
ncbi:holin [Streptomyces sp. NPDC053048]|uniref:holin n=1 Tax=Streptomyces sp. NPDC053048 TaxID=3365694 RepID=UPI0037D40B82